MWIPHHSPRGDNKVAKLFEWGGLHTFGRGDDHSLAAQGFEVGFGNLDIADSSVTLCPYTVKK